MIEYFKTLQNSSTLLKWKTKGLSKEIIKLPKINVAFSILEFY